MINTKLPIKIRKVLIAVLIVSDKPYRNPLKRLVGGD